MFPPTDSAKSADDVFPTTDNVKDINPPGSLHVETVVSLSHKNADSHVNINIEFGDEQGQIPIDGIAQKAELI